MPKMRNVTLEDVTPIFRNFAGKEGKFNKAGDRNFSILLDPDRAEQMEKDGWNVKYLKARDEGEEPQAYLQVAVSYKARPPKMVMITSRGLTYLGEDEIDVLDYVDVEQCDVTLNPYEWDVSGNQGVKAYAVSVYIKIVEDYLELKWQAWADEQNGGQTALPQGQHELPESYIDAEFVEEMQELEAA